MLINMNYNDIAKEIFEEIRDRPYRVALYPDRAENCYYKGTELIDRLTTLGFAMRARIAEIQWDDTPCPKELLSLHPTDADTTHFYPEIFLDNEWKILDPSWNKSFAQKYDLPYSEFGQNNESCFKIHKLLDQEEQASYVAGWSAKLENPQAFKQYEPFLTALNEWLEEVNPQDKI